MLLIKWNAFANSESSFTVIVGLNTPSRIPFEMVLNSPWLCTWVAVGITCLTPQPCRLIAKVETFPCVSLTLWRQFFDTTNEPSSSPINTKHLHFNPSVVIRLCKNYCGSWQALLWLRPLYCPRLKEKELLTLVKLCVSWRESALVCRRSSHFPFTQLLRFCCLCPCS